MICVDFMRMRIGINFHTADRYISGVEYYALGMIDALLRLGSGNEYIVFTNSPEIVEQHVRCSDRLTIRKIKGLKARSLRILWEHFQLPRLARREGIDVLHCPGYICPAIYGRIPCIVTIHDTIAINNPRWCKPSNALYYNLAMKAGLKKAAGIVAVSNCSADDLRSNFSFCADKIKVIYPGIDDLFNNHEHCDDSIQVRTRYNLPQRFVLFVGNLEPKKNIAAIIAAYLLLRDKGFSHKLVIVGRRSWGKGNALNELMQRAGKNIVFTGYVARDDLPTVYKLADVFLPHCMKALAFHRWRPWPVVSPL